MSEKTSDIKFSVKDVRGIEIVYTNERWENHVIRFHEDMEGQEQSVINTLVNPYRIDGSSIDDISDVYHGKWTGGYKKYIRVVVTSKKGYNTIITAFPVEGVGKSVDPEKPKYRNADSPL